VPHPPRLRPSASQAAVASPFFRVGRGVGQRGEATGSGGVLMRADVGAVHADDGPGQVARGVRLALERLQHALPDALAAPP
jgi:hypothetical protein